MTGVLVRSGDEAPDNTDRGAAMKEHSEKAAATIFQGNERNLRKKQTLLLDF